MATTTSGVAEVAQRFTDTVNGVSRDPDFAGLFADSIVVFRCYDDEEMQVPGAMIAAALLEEVDLIPEAMPDYHLEGVRLRVDNDSFVLARIQMGTLPDGTKLKLAQILVNFVENGRIVRSEAYYDRPSAAPLHNWFATKHAAGEFTFEVASEFTAPEAN